MATEIDEPRDRAEEKDVDYSPFYFRDAGIGDIGVLIRLVVMLREYRKQILLIVVGMAIYSATVMAVPFIIGQALDSFLENSDMSELLRMIPVFVAVGLIQFCSHHLQLTHTEYLSQRLVLTLRVRLFDVFHRLPIRYLDRTRPGEIMSSVQNDVLQMESTIGMHIAFLGDCFSLIALIGGLFLLDMLLGLSVLVVIGVFGAVLVFWQRRTGDAFFQVQSAAASLTGALEEAIAGRAWQSTGRWKQPVKRRVGFANAKHYERRQRAEKYAASISPVVEIGSAGALGVVTIIGVLQYTNNWLSIGVLVACILYCLRIFEPLRDLGMHVAMLKQGLIAGRRILTLLEMNTAEGIIETNDDNVSMNEFCFRNVSFAYVSGHMVLKDINLIIRRGETIAIVGPTGAGKTTLVSLLMRLYEPSSGTITVDGRDITCIDRLGYLGNIGTVSQSPYFFSGTVLDNIRYTSGKIAAHEIASLLKVIGASPLLDKLEEGLQTQVSERAANLSGGQKQAVAIARALVRRPSLLVLDEAAANLDSRLQYSTLKGIKKILPDATFVLIAHRLESVMDADRIVVLVEGRIVEQGTHVELLSKEAYYANAWRSGQSTLRSYSNHVNR